MIYTNTKTQEKKIKPDHCDAMKHETINNNNNNNNYFFTYIAQVNVSTLLFSTAHCTIL